MSEPLAELIAVEKSFPAPDGPLPVLKNISLRLEPRETLALLGPSGSGKSTLLNVLGGLDRPTSGKTLFEGRDLAQLNEQALAKFRNQRLGFIFQAHHLLPQCSVLENALVPTLAKSTAVWATATEAEAYAIKLLERVGLGARMHHRPGQLSGGERQRAAAARALIHKPALVLADEPTGSLDRENATRLADLLLELQSGENGFALVVATHSAEFAARMSRACRLQDGALVPGA